MIAVFLNNKLISCDSILPLLYEARSESGPGRVEFYCFNKATYESIQSNVVMWDLINRIGRLVLITKKPSSRLGYFVQRGRTLWLVGRLALLALLGRVTFIHFAALNEMPWKVLFKLNRDNTLLCEPSAIGFTQREEKLMEIQGARSSQPEHLSASALICFQDDWKVLHHPDAQGLPVYHFGSPRSREHWLSVIQQEADSYFDKEFKSVGINATDRVIVFILGYLGEMGFMKNPESMKALFHETLSMLSELKIEMPVFIKPHAVTDENYIREAIQEYQDLNIVITGLHPAVLATRAHFFIGNYYSSTFYDARVHNVPTVEYTEYSESIKEAMGGKSIRPEFVTHSIQRDPDELRSVLNSLEMTTPRTRNIGPILDESGLLKRLSAC